MAYIPASREGRGQQTYLQRPRFLALAEFGPRSLVYHEGRAYRVVRALLPLGGKEEVTGQAELPTPSARPRPPCQTPPSEAVPINYISRIENVATQPAERITANDEERQRQGFELQTTFEWATRDHELDAQRGGA